MQLSCENTPHRRKLFRYFCYGTLFFSFLVAFIAIELTITILIFLSISAMVGWATIYEQKVVEEINYDEIKISSPKEYIVVRYSDISEISAGRNRHGIHIYLRFREHTPLGNSIFFVSNDSSFRLFSEDDKVYKYIKAKRDEATQT